MRSSRGVFLRFSFLSWVRGVKRPLSLPAYEMDRFYIAGFQYHEGPRVLDRMTEGQELTLVREPTNPHDDRAVALFWKDRKIGYVPCKRNHAIARLADQDAPLSCKVTVVDRYAKTWEAVEVSIAIQTQAVASPSRIEKRWLFGVSIDTRNSAVVELDDPVYLG